jgi:putative lipoprotein
MTRAPAFALFVATIALSTAAFADDSDPWISRDKAFHFDVSAGIAAAGYGISAAWLVDARWKALAIGGGIALATGAGKEIFDATGILGGDPSWKDFTWDAIGTVAGLAIAWGIDLLLGGVDRSHPALGSPSTNVAPASVRLRF